MKLHLPCQPYLVAIATICVVLTACGSGTATPAGKSEGSTPAVSVRTQLVETIQLKGTTQAIGTAKARESVALTAKVTEVVDRIHFDSGQEVQTGALLVTLRDEAQRATLLQAELHAAETQRLFERSSELAGRHLIPISELEKQEFSRDAARAVVLQMRAAVSDRAVRAPFAGRLGFRQVSPGALVTPTTVVTTLDDISRIYVDFHLPETEMAAARVGAVVTARSAAHPDARFTGNVSTIDTRVDPQTRAVLIRADFPNPDRLLQPGMLLNVRLMGAPRQAVVVPEMTVTQLGSEAFVFTIGADSKAQQVSVQTGERMDGKVEIIKGLAPGDRAVVDGVGKLRPGLRTVDTVPVAGG